MFIFLHCLVLLIVALVIISSQIFILLNLRPDESLVQNEGGLFSGGILVITVIVTLLS
ncbi:unnamed protein product, partial [Brachionus calyciflorus]